MQQSRFDARLNATRRLMPALVLAIAIAAPTGLSAADADGPSKPAPQCRTSGAASGEDGQTSRTSIERSLPGWWRQEMKRDGVQERVPGTRTVQPRNPAPVEVSTEGRWLPGYRPATVNAQAEFEAWKARQNARAAGIEGAETPRTPSSNYAKNILSGKRVSNVPEEPISLTVREETYPLYPIDLRTLDASNETTTRDKGPSTEFHHGSGMTWNEYLQVKELARTSPTTPDAQVAEASDLRAPTFDGVGFDAITANGEAVPPDPIMAVGPTHLIALVNRSYQVWDKSGAPLIDSLSLDDFFAGVPNCDTVFDVYVDYDEANDRFVMGGMTVYTATTYDSYLCLAATATNDPTGVWNRASFRADGVATDTWIDFPHMGIGLDAIYITGNMFVDGGGLDHVRGFAVDKDALYAGTPITIAEANLSSLFFTAQPVKIHGYTSGGWPAAGTPHHIVAHDAGGNTRIWRWIDPFSLAPVIYGTIAEANFNGIPPNAPELGGTSGDLNDTGSAKWLDAEYRAGKLWTTRNVACDFGGGTSESCIDWIQVDVSGTSPILEQQQAGGAYGTADEFRYYPDVSVDRNLNIAIGYTKSSEASYTEVWVTGRESDDPAGTLQAETLQRAGLGTYIDNVGCQGSCDRWGDYTGLTVDPDGCTFWYLGQYSDGGFGAWGTHIGSFRFDSCSVDSSLQVDKGTYTCDDSIVVTVTDSTPIDAATVSAQTTVYTSGSDSETVAAGNWSGSDCGGGTCETWTTTLPVSGDPGADDDGTLNVNDGETITVDYTDPHAGHADQTRDASVTCSTRLEDGGYFTRGGCEDGQGTETYRDYMDGGEYISYTFGIFNPQTAAPLTDVSTTLTVSGPAADKVVIFNPTMYIGALDRGELTGPVFQLYIDPSIDAEGLRLSEHDFNLLITSAADGFTAIQTMTQNHLLQTDDNIVSESQCWNFESGDQGFVNEPLIDSYDCGPPEGCDGWYVINTIEAPWTRGTGCGSETRDDYPEMTCDVAGMYAFMSNGDPASCNVFPQSTSELVDDVLYSPVFGPNNTGLAPNGQPWNFDWRYAEWFYRSDMYAGSRAAMAAGFFWDDNYAGVSDPGFNEINTYYSYIFGYLAYPNQGWDSATPWDDQAPPANFDIVSFDGADGLATADLQWRWAVEVFDTDYNDDPTRTPATAGLALDDMNLSYDQYHAEAQVGICADAPAVVSLDRYSYLDCPTGELVVSVMDGNAAGSVLVTVVSSETGDSETFYLYGDRPLFTASLPYSTAAGPQDDDGTLFVTANDVVGVTYGGGGSDTNVALAGIACEGGDVVADGVAALQDNGDGDSYADTNETVDISIRIKNNTGLPLQNVTAIITSNDPTVDCITKSAAYIGTLAADGGTGSNDLLSDPFTFKVSPTAECGNPQSAPTATFQVLIQADDFDGPQTPQFVTMVLDLNDLPGTVTFVEDFSTDPDGFRHELGPGDDDGVSVGAGGLACSPYVDEFFWRGTGGNPGGGYFAWQDPADDFPNGTYSDLSDSVLYSPVFKIGSTATTLSFDHEYLFGFTGEYRLDGTRVDYRVNGGSWQKMTNLPYDGPLIWNTYCSPLCNGTEFGLPCFTEVAESGENIFNNLALGVVNWTNASGAISGLNSGDQLQFRWRMGSMNTSAFGLSTTGGYGLDNVSVTNVVEQVCDTAANPDVGCGVVFDGSGNLVEVCGDGDAIVEPTESWSVDVTLRNSAASPSVNATADLATNIGNTVPASVGGNPGSYGTLAAAGGTATNSYSFTVGAGAVCIDDVTFDVVNIADDGALYADLPAAFSVQVGGVTPDEVASQSVSPLVVSSGKVASSLLPALATPTPADSVTVSYGFQYNNLAPEEVATQDTDPLAVENGTSNSTLSAPFALSPGNAVSAVVDWTGLTHNDVQDCVRVYLVTPSGFNFTLKATGSLDNSPYDVLNVYQHANGGIGQYRIGLEEVQSGPCKNAATITGTTMTVTGPESTGSWLGNARVTLWDGSAEYLLKNFGSQDTAPYDVTAIYNTAGPGTYELRLEENGGGGLARLSGGTMTAVGIECDLGCAGFTPPAPPVADGVSGTYMTLDPGAGPDDLLVTIDNATCSASRAVIVYGNIGDYSGYQGAVDTGCNLGTGPAATVTHAGDNVWFNVIWVNEDEDAGHPGYGSGGSRTWDAAGMCGVLADDPSDGTCN